MQVLRQSEVKVLAINSSSLSKGYTIAILTHMPSSNLPQTTRGIEVSTVMQLFTRKSMTDALF